MTEDIVTRITCLDVTTPKGSVDVYMKDEEMIYVRVSDGCGEEGTTCECRLLEDDARGLAWGLGQTRASISFGTGLATVTLDSDYDRGYTLFGVYNGLLTVRLQDHDEFVLRRALVKAADLAEKARKERTDAASRKEGCE